MSVTQLEMRLAPATFVGANDVTYYEAAGQLVDVHISLPVFTSSNVNNLFTFKTGSTGLQQLQELDLTKLGYPSPASGASLTITVTPPSGSKAVPVEVGFINATGIALGAVTVPGDLGGIDAGDGMATLGLASLSVQTMGAYGTTTQPPGGSLESDILGSLGTLTVSGNIDGAFINVSGGAGSIGTVSVGGSLIGGTANYSGEISASGDVGGVTVVGSLTGGAGVGSGAIFAGGNLGTVSIGGNVVGEGGTSSGSITAGGNLAGVTVTGSLTGGAGDYSGEIGSALFTTGNVGPVQIGGNVVGAGGDYSGTLYAGGNLASVTVVGSVDGGAGGPSGAIFAIGNITGQVQIGKGVQGGTGEYFSGSISADGTLANVTVGGALAGGAGDYSGDIVANDDVGQVTVGGGVAGAAGEFSGGIGSFYGNVAGVTVGSATLVSSVVGGLGDYSGGIFADSGVLGPVKITGNLQGGYVSGGQSVTGSGFLFGEQITSVSITGSVIAGTGAGTMTDSATIRATWNIGAITVGGLVGNSKNPVVISARGQEPGTLPANSTTDIAITQITVVKSSVVGSGNVSFTNILAGYSPSGVAVNGSAQIGPVSVGGNWTASNLVAGASAGPDGQFGTADDAPVKSDYPDAISEIGATIVTTSGTLSGIVIGGTVSGNVNNSAVHYGFVAQEVASLKVGTTTIMLTPGPNNDHLVKVNSTGTVTVNEV